MGGVFSSRSSSSDEGGVPVVLNVYDLTPLNNYLYWFGVGIFHSGIEVHGLEYAFGAHDYPTTGVFEVEPKNCPGFSYRCSISLGRTSMPPSEFRAFIENIAADYHGDTYHLISKNCNHFTDDASLRLTRRPIPGWVNRLAWLGTVCNCLLPESLRLPAAKPEYHGFSDGSESFSFITTTTHDPVEIDEADQGKHLLSPSSDGEVTFVNEVQR